MTEEKTIQWQQLLTDAVNKPGSISSAYSVFWNYSCGNQILAWSQCHLRGIEAGPLASYKKWKGLGRQVQKGPRPFRFVCP